MSRTKHPEYATPPATVHPTDIARGLVDPDEAARRWNAHDALVALARRLAGTGAPTRTDVEFMQIGARYILDKMDGSK